MASLESGLECRDCRWRRNGRREGDCVCVKGEGREKGIMDWEGRKIVG